MTVSYTYKLIHTSRFHSFLKLLVRWRGSVYKLVWPDLFVFLACYFSLSLTYRFLLDQDGKRLFEKISVYCEKYASLIPLSFVLGFYVSLIVGRWWERYKIIPWIDTLAIWVHSTMRGDEEMDRIVRRNVMRYVCLGITQSFILISPRVKARFPTLGHLVNGGLLLENEKEIMAELNASAGGPIGAEYPTNFVPFVWAAGLLASARAENRIKNDSLLKCLLDEINRIKDNCNLLIKYDWISVPLVYTQVVTLAVYSFFVACVMGRQSTTSGFGKNGVEGLDTVFPLFTVLQFLFYIGWLKVAESLLDPFGDDDDDFEINWVVDRNLQVAYVIVDKMYRMQPEVRKDPHWDMVVPSELPHTNASQRYNEKPPISSTAHIVFAKRDTEIHCNWNSNEKCVRNHCNSVQTKTNDDPSGGRNLSTKFSRVFSKSQEILPPRSCRYSTNGNGSQQGDVCVSLINLPCNADSTSVPNAKSLKQNQLQKKLGMVDDCDCEIDHDSNDDDDSV